jgi:hypothetical protein
MVTVRHASSIDASGRGSTLARRAVCQAGIVGMLAAGVVTAAIAALVLTATRAGAETVPRRAITDLEVVTGSTADVQCPAGYVRNPQDLNEGAGGDFIYLCLRYELYPWAEGTWGLSNLRVDTYAPGFQGARFSECPDEIDGPRRRELIDVDLNKGAGGQFSYFCTTYTTLPQEPTGLLGFIYDIGFATSDTFPADPDPTVDPVDEVCEEQVDPTAFAASGGDLNSFAGGKYIYACIVPAGALSFADASPPLVTPVVTGTLGQADWYISDVTVSWMVEDPESSIEATQGCDPIVITADTAGQTLTCTATSEGGTTTESVTVKRDATPPQITASRTPEPNTAGWNNTDVTVSFTCDDATSGVASCADAQTLTDEGAGQSVTGMAADQAGNTASLTVEDINIDKTSPQLACTADPDRLWPPDHRLVPVTVEVTGDDQLSGFASFVLNEATSNEPDDGRGDGHTTGDIRNFDIGTADTEGELRAERSGRGQGRIYTLIYSGADAAGNDAACTVTVEVRHDQGRR